jgi:hypothetical protein
MTSAAIATGVQQTTVAVVANDLSAWDALQVGARSLLGMRSLLLMKHLSKRLPPCSRCANFQLSWAAQRSDADIKPSFHPRSIAGLDISWDSSGFAGYACAGLTSIAALFFTALETAICHLTVVQL